MEDLRTFLRDLPHEIGYNHTRINTMRVKLRSKLFSAATVNGQYLSLLFDNFQDSMDPRLDPASWIAEDSGNHSHDGRPCIRKLRQGEPTYRCLTCGLDDTCVLCKYCYNPADHEGHDVFVKITHRDDGGICDCGDLEAWNNDLHCISSTLQSPSYAEVPKELQDALAATAETALDYCIDVLSTAHCGLQFFDSDDSVHLNTLESKLDPEVYGGEDVPGDGKYVLLIWNDERRTFNDAASEVQLATHKTIDFGHMIAERVDAYGRAVISASGDLRHILEQKRTIKLVSATVRSTRDYIREEMCDEIISWLFRLSQAKLRGMDPRVLSDVVGDALLGPWRVGNQYLRLSAREDLLSTEMSSLQQIWRHTYLQGSSIPSPETTNFMAPDPDTRTQELGSQLHLTFSDLLKGSQDPKLMQLLYRRTLRSGDSLQSLAHLSVLPPDPNSDTLEPSHPSAFWVEEGEESRAMGIQTAHSQAHLGTSRAQYFIFFDMRLWKSLRVTLTDLYVSTLISNVVRKAQLGRLYADLYPQIAEMYVFTDREPEVSVISFLSTQLFTTPSVATEMFALPYFSRYVATLYLLLSTERAGAPANIKTGLTINSSVLKNRKFGQLFHELVFLLSRNTVKLRVVGDPRRLLMFADFLSLFQGFWPMKRLTDKHVEFETDTWFYLFTTIPLVLQASQALAYGVHETTFDEVKGGIQTLSYVLHRWSFEYYAALSDGVVPQISVDTIFGNDHLERILSGYSIEDSVASLQHPVHIFLAYLLENAKIENVESLREVLFGFDETWTETFDTQFARSLLFENVLQSLALLSQIHVGLWVRNGYSVRSQLHHYRESTLRELAFMRDVFLAQTALVALDTNTAMLQLLHRWNMIDWADNQLFDESQSYYMLEEFIHTLTFLLVDRVYLQGHSEQDLKQELFKREIVQCLAFRDMSFGQLSQLVPESMTAEDLFESVLKDSTTFTPPKGVRDVGMYSLKEELRSSFDTHYIHFSSARIEEAEGMVAEYYSRKDKTRADDVVHVPPLLPATGPWSDLGAFTRSVSFARFMLDLFETMLLDHVDSNQAHVETVLGKSLYLLIRAAQNDITRDKSKTTLDPHVYESIASWMDIRDSTHGDSLLGLIQVILSKPELSSLHARSRKLISLLHQLDPVTVPYAGEDTEVQQGPVEREVDKKKRKGKEVQARILEELRKQQEQFAKNAAVEDDGMDTHRHEDADGDADMVAEDEDGGWSFPKSQCVLCHMPDTEDSIFGVMTYSSPARIQRCLPIDSSPSWIGEGFANTSSSLDVESPYYPGDITGDSAWNSYWEELRKQGDPRAYPQEHTKVTPVIVGCGHGMHYACYDNFIKQSNRSWQLTRVTPDHAAKGEYLCPLCRAVNNGFMPVLWTRNTLSPEQLYAPPEDVDAEVETLLSLGEHQGISSTLNLEILVDQAVSVLQPKFQEALLPRNTQSLSSRGSTVGITILSQMARIISAYEDSPKLPEENEMRSSKMALKVFSTSIAATEISLRGVKHESPLGGLLMDQLSGKQRQLLRVLAQYMRTLVGLVSRSYMHSQREQQLPPPSNKGFTLLMGKDMDPFVQFVQSLYFGSAFSFSPFILLRSFYTAAIVQFMTEVTKFHARLDSIPVPGLASKEILERLAILVPTIPAPVVYGMLTRYVTIFLRRVALLTFALCGDYDADNFACMMGLPEHERLCMYLQLPKVDSVILDIADASTLSGKLARKMDGVASFLPLEYPGIYRLIHLPEILHSFFDAIPRNTKIAGGDPAICLFCGKSMPLQHDILESSVGPATAHITTCATQYGIYIVPKRNSLLLLTKTGRGSFLKAPYLDLHGEVDESMRRGRPHYLQQNRYDSLIRSLWLEHGLASFIGRKLDQSVDFGGWETL